LNALS